MDNKKLGVYFGKDKIAIVEAKGVRITQSISIPYADLSGNFEAHQSADASMEVKIVAAMQAALKNSKMEAKEAIVGLSSKDLFIRGFQMPLLNKNEIDTGVRFEAKKYLPSRSEELVSDFQSRPDKKLGKMDVLFVATTSNSLNRHLSMFEQAGIPMRVVEPASLSLVRIIFLNKQIDVKSSLAVVSVQDSDVEFSIFIEGFPCYNRDIKLVLPLGLQEPEGGPVFLERLSSEIRVSLDYFRRQFSGRGVDKIILFAKNISAGIREDLSKNLGMDVQDVDLSKNSELSGLADLDMLKSYSLAVRDAVKTSLVVDLLKKVREKGILKEADESFVFNLAALQRPLIKNALFLGAAFLALSSILSIPFVGQAEKKLASWKRQVENTVPTELSGLTAGELGVRKGQLNKKLRDIKEVLKKEKVYVISYFNGLPKVIKTGLFINEFDVQNDDNGRTLRIKGAASLNDEAGEKKLIDNFLKDLKGNKEITKGLKDWTLVTSAREKSEDCDITVFEISGK